MISNNHDNTEIQERSAAVTGASGGPLVSCLMVTQRSRLEMARRAIRCFSAQTYPNRELIVVSDDDISELGVEFTREPRGLVLGDLRNRAVAHARGTIVCQWDDDDWYAPERIIRQLEALLASPNADACVLSRWTVLDLRAGRISQAALAREGGWEGSVLAHKHKMPVYPSKRIGEDNVILDMKLVRLNRPDLYTYIVHGNNTWHEAHFDFMFSVADKILSPDDARRVLEEVLAT